MRILLCALLVALAALLPRTARAHQLGLSRGEYFLTADRLDIELHVSSRELATALPALDVNADGELSADELAASGELLDRDVLGRLDVRSGGARCPVERGSERLEGDDAVLAAQATCPSGARDLELTFGFLVSFAAGHRHLAHVRAGASDHETVAVQAAPTVRVDVGRVIERRSERTRFDARLGGVAAVAFVVSSLSFLQSRRRRPRRATVST